MPSTLRDFRSADQHARDTLFDLMVSPFSFPLQSLFSSQSAQASSLSSSFGDDDDDMEYSLQPLPYMTTIGEHLLLMVQLLAPLARGDIRRASPVRKRWSSERV